MIDETVIRALICFTLSLTLHLEPLRRRIHVPQEEVSV